MRQYIIRLQKKRSLVSAEQNVTVMKIANVILVDVLCVLQFKSVAANGMNAYVMLDRLLMNKQFWPVHTYFNPMIFI